MSKRIVAASAALMMAASAQAQRNPPEIAYESVPNFFQLPENVYFGEVAGIAVNSQKHVFVLSRGNTSGPAYGAAAAQLLEFDQHGAFVREIGKNLYAWAYSHTVRVDRNDDIWVTDKGSDMVVRFDPAGRVKMVFGRKPEASNEEAHPLARPAAAAADRSAVPPSHGRRVGLRRQHLHHRRLRQLAGCEIRP
jgi:streptogramin lyase